MYSCKTGEMCREKRKSDRKIAGWANRLCSEDGPAEGDEKE